MPNGYEIPIQCYKFYFDDRCVFKEKIIKIQQLFSIVVSRLNHQRLFNNDSESANQCGIPNVYLILFQYYQIHFMKAVFSKTKQIQIQQLFIFVLSRLNHQELINTESEAASQ